MGGAANRESKVDNPMTLDNPTNLADTSGRQTLVSQPVSSFAPSGARPGTSSMLPRASMQQVMLALRAAVTAGDSILGLSERSRSSGIAPDPHVLAAFAAIFAGQLRAVNAALASIGTHVLLPEIADTDLVRIKRASAELFRLGRRTGAPQREANLEHVFDEKHELRQRLADPEGTANRAFQYYDEANTAEAPHVGATPSAVGVSVGEVV